MGFYDAFIIVALWTFFANGAHTWLEHNFFWPGILFILVVGVLKSDLWIAEVIIKFNREVDNDSSFWSLYSAWRDLVKEAFRHGFVTIFEHTVSVIMISIGLRLAWNRLTEPAGTDIMVKRAGCGMVLVGLLTCQLTVRS